MQVEVGARDRTVGECADGTTRAFRVDRAKDGIGCRPQLFPGMQPRRQLGWQWKGAGATMVYSTCLIDRAHPGGRKERTVDILYSALDTDKEIGLGTGLLAVTRTGVCSGAHGLGAPRLLIDTRLGAHSAHGTLPVGKSERTRLAGNRELHRIFRTNDDLHGSVKKRYHTLYTSRMPGVAIASIRAERASGGLTLVYRKCTLQLMTTKLIGIKEFRANMSDFVRKAQAGDVRYVVMNRNKPFFEVRPLRNEDESEVAESVLKDIETARADVAAGRVHSLDEVEERLGL